jgi:flavin-dependent dehydrogenase
MLQSDIRFDLPELSTTVWDAAVVGAGPAGSVVAAMLAERGWHVLLLERALWPRDKVCGGCLNESAVRWIRAVGMGDSLTGALPIDRVALRVNAGRATLALPGAVAIDRCQLDAAIVRCGIARGVTFVSGVSVKLLPGSGADRARQLRVSRPDVPEPVRVSARVVLACDGIGGHLLDDEPWAQWTVARDAWFGVAARLRRSAGFAAPTGEIAMHMGQGGYVGVTRYANGDVHLAAALQPDACRRGGGPAGVIDRILRDCGQSYMPDIRAAGLHGTGLLTRFRALIGGHRALAVGDACGYVEPFTGEGIAWAVRGAVEVVDLLGRPSAAWPDDMPDRWRHRYGATIGPRQRLCRAARWALHRPRVASGAMAMLALWPSGVGRYLARRDGPGASTIAGHPGAFA